LTGSHRQWLTALNELPGIGVALFFNLHNAIMTNINYYPVHRSGCSFKRDSLIDKNRMYINSFALGTEEIELICDFLNIPVTTAYYLLFTIDNAIDYSSFNSLN